MELFDVHISFFYNLTLCFFSEKNSCGVWFIIPTNH